MFLHIIDNIYIVNQSVAPLKSNIKVVDWFETVSHRNHWEEYRKYFPGMNQLLKVTAAIVGNEEAILAIPDEDFHKFLREYCIFLNLDNESAESMYIYSNACSLYSEGIFAYSNPQGIMDRKPFAMQFADSVENINIDFKRFPLEFSVNCLDQEWARQAFEFKRSEAIFSTVKEIQFLAMRNGSMGPEEFKDISGNREIEAKKLLKADFRFKILDALDRVGFNTEEYRKPIELYVDGMPDFGINASEPFKFNYLLAGHIKETGYRIDSRTRSSK